MGTFAVILLAVAVSIDGFGVGLAYGLGKMRLPINSLLILGLASALAMLVSMLAGTAARGLFVVALTNLIGPLLLVGFGLWMLWQQLGSEQSQDGLMGLIREPGRADADHSGTISSTEGMVLGIALAMDAFGAGFGAALAGFPPLETSLAVGLAKIFLVGSGVLLGSSILSGWKVRGLKYAPGAIIVFLGLANLLLL
jgi:putative sporulation protein YtaF